MFRLLSICIVSLLVLPNAAKAGANCEQRKELVRAVSPDGVWVASVFKNVCSDGWFVTTVSETVEIRPSSADPSKMPSDRQLVFGMDALDDHEPIELKWRDESSLEVAVPVTARAGTQRAMLSVGSAKERKTITVVYRYEPDDPVARRCVEKWQSLMSQHIDHGGPMPPALNAFINQCRRDGVGAGR